MEPKWDIGQSYVGYELSYVAFLFLSIPVQRLP